MMGLFKNTISSDAVLLVGLGNPGAQYQGHRHNIGFMAIDEIASRELGFSPFKKKFNGLYSEGRIGTRKVILLKPETYMNESGRSVQQAAHFFKVAPENIIVFHDELDIAPGKVRMKLGGGNAGHNGLKSIQACMGTPDYWRVRLGIGHPGDKSRVSGYVLSDFSKEDQRWLLDLLYALSRKVDVLMTDERVRYAEMVSTDLGA
jgi:peptidyl-tRNA hydrolase, PTH1 family